MSWLDRLRGGFQKTAERVADNLTGVTSRAALDTATLDDVEEALIEGDGTGHTDNFAPVALAGARRGETGEVRITGRDSDRLTAVWA